MYPPLHTLRLHAKDLAKLFQVDQGANQGILIDTRENLAGDVERRDVAECVVRLIDDSDNVVDEGVIFSVINKPGPRPSEYEWGRLLSLCTVPKPQLETTRESSFPSKSR